MKNNFFRGFPVVAGAALLVFSTGLVQAAGLKTLPSRVPGIVARLNLKAVGSLAKTNRLRLAIGLPLRHREALTNLLHEIYDPASPDYHHYLTLEQFTALFGPSEQQYQDVIAFAKAHGFTVTGTYLNRMVLDVSGRVADIQNAFHVKMRLYHHPTENRTFYAPDVEPSVPSALPILQISGLNNYELPHPQIITMPRGLLPQAGSALGGGYSASDLRKAYVPGMSLTGAGQNVGLLEFDGFYPADVAQYASMNNIQNPPKVVVVPVDGGIATPGSANIEVAMDIEMIMAMAPGVSTIYVYEAPFAPPSPFVDILNRMANDNSAGQLSSSWGGGVQPNPTAEQIFQQMAAQGQSFYNAVGDTAAFIPNINPPIFPSDSPNITQVGGTVLTTTSSGDYSSETVWNTPDIPRPPSFQGGSGGVSLYYPIPTWQQGISMVANHGSTTMRNMPDVAMIASGISIVFDNGVYGPDGGGTSSAAPLWAGFTALINQQATASGLPPVGFINPALYAIGKGPNYDTDFHDITTGGNTNSLSPTNYLAVPGYDLCTGWGTPNGPNLINELVGKRTGILQTIVNPPSGSALLQSTTQPITVTVNDVFGVTNATVTASVTNNLGTLVTNLSFINSGQGNYGTSLSAPAAANPLTMVVTATAPDEIGNTNVVNYFVIGRPPNDNFANATKVPAGGSSYLENNTYATLETNEPPHDGDQNDAASLWWRWTPTASTNVFIDTVGSKVENVLAVYTGSALTSLNPVAATNSMLTLYKPAQLSFNAQGGVTYRIAVASESSNSLGTVTLNVAPGGQPDTNAPVVFIASPQSGLTVFSRVIGIDGTAFDPGANASGVSQVFVTVNGTPMTAMGTTNWTVLAAVHPGLNFIKASAMDEAGNVSPTTTIQVNYLVEPPANDYFVNAIPLAGNSGTITNAVNTAATKEVGEPNPAGNPGGKSLWWSFTPLHSGVLTLNTSNSTFDTIMGLYTGTNVANLTTIADNDDAYSGAPGGFSYISQAVTNGQTYYILVDGYDGASGTISLGYSFTSVPVYHLTVNTSGGGTVQLLTTNSLGGLSILPSTSADFAGGSTAVLKAFPDYNDQFDMWSNDVVSLNNPLSVVVNSDLTITANFVARQFTDGFESGNLSHLTWVTAGDAPWFVQTNVVDVGQYAARSGVITNSQSSSLILTTNFVAGTGSFDFKVSSEQYWDTLSFYVDTNLLAQWSGQIDWANYAFPLTAGKHTLEWTYAKDATISLGLDAAFIDDVDLPIALTPGIATTARIQLQQETGGGWFMNLTGQSGQQYVVQRSSDLLHWRNVSTNIAYSGFIRIPLPSSPTNHAQFYRAVAP